MFVVVQIVRYVRMSRFFSGKCIFSLCSHNSQLIHSLFCICVLLHCPCDEVDVLLLQCSSLTRYSKLTFLSSTCCNSPVDKCTKSDHKKHSLNSFHNCLLNFFITFLHPIKNMLHENKTKANQMEKERILPKIGKTI
jgi:hypothetical protein